jgi:prolyl 4-hydroxylase
MKSEYFLVLPLMATLFNLLLVHVLFSQSAPRASAQPVLLESLSGRCASDGHCAESNNKLDSYNIDSDGTIAASDKVRHFQLQRKRTNVTEATPTEALVDSASKLDILLEDALEEKDPNLKLLPGTEDFEAYVRADIATYYQQEPGSRTEVKPAYSGQAGKFVNLSPEKVTLYWDGPNGPILNGDVNPWGAGGTSCFPGHRFIFTEHKKSHKVLCRFEVTPGISVYYCDPFASSPHPGLNHALPGTLPDNIMVRSLDSLSSQDLEKYEAHVYNLKFGEMYQNFTGSPWLTMYPPNPVKHKIWRADFFGQEHHVVTRETQFHSIPPTLQQIDSLDEMKNPERYEDFRGTGTLNITVRAVSCTPRAFEIKNFLSDTEVEHLLNIVKQRNLERSTTNGHVSSTRTSKTTWIPRGMDPVTNAIFRRVADVLRLDEALLRNRQAGEVPEVNSLSRVNEDLQVVHYDVGQEYTAHHDFGYPTVFSQADKISRSINLCMYLNDVPAGGQTSFPRWRNAETSKSIDVTPEKGKAMIFYMVNPDGNLEDLSQHAALPVIEGEKFFTNLWIRSFQ